MFGQFLLCGQDDSALTPHGNKSVIEDRAGNAHATATYTYKTDGTTTKTTQVGGTVANDTWGSGASGYWIYAKVTVDIGTGLASGTANTWLAVTVDRPFGVDAPVGPDDQQVHAEIFMQASVGSPGTSPTQAAPAGSTYMGTLNLHATSEP